MKKLYDLKCPFCGEQMVPFRREIVESGEPTYWEYGWSCGCNEEIREKVKKEGGAVENE